MLRVTAACNCRLRHQTPRRIRDTHTKNELRARRDGSALCLGQPDGVRCLHRHGDGLGGARAAFNLGDRLGEEPRREEALGGNQLLKYKV